MFLTEGKGSHWKQQYSRHDHYERRSTMHLRSSAKSRISAGVPPSCLSSKSSYRVDDPYLSHTAEMIPTLPTTSTISLWLSLLLSCFLRVSYALLTLFLTSVSRHEEFEVRKRPGYSICCTINPFLTKFPSDFSHFQRGAHYRAEQWRGSRES